MYGDVLDSRMYDVLRRELEGESRRLWPGFGSPGPGRRLAPLAEAARAMGTTTAYVWTLAQAGLLYAEWRSGALQVEAVILSGAYPPAPPESGDAEDEPTSPLRAADGSPGGLLHIPRQRPGRARGTTNAGGSDEEPRWLM